MALFEVEAKTAIIDVSFSPDHTYMSVLHQSGVDLYQWQIKGPRSLRPTLKASVVFDVPLYETTALVSAVDVNGSVTLLGHGHHPELHYYAFDPEAGLFAGLSRAKADSIVGFSSYHESGGESGLVFQDYRRRFHMLHTDGTHAEFLLSPTTPHLSVQLPWFTPVRTDSTVAQIAVYGLSRNGHLHANNRLLVKNCTSYLVTPDHVIFTTTNHLLKFIHRTDEIDGKSKPSL